MVAPFMHHFPLELFIGSKNTLDLFSLILKRDNATIRKTIRKKRRKSQTRIRYLIELLAVRNPNLAATYYSKYNFVGHSFLSSFVNNEVVFYAQ